MGGQAGRRVNRNAFEILPVESAKMRLVAGKQNVAPAMDGGRQHGAVFFGKFRGDFSRKETAGRE